MRSQQTSRTVDARALSNTLSVILLTGVVVTGAVVVGLVGSQSLGQLQDSISGESSEKSMREIDSRISSLAIESSETRVTLDFGDQDTDDIYISDRGYVNVSINRNLACSANVSLSSIRMDLQGDKTRAYEMGGIWVTANGSTTMASPPQLRFDDGRLSMTVTNFTGNIDESSEVVTKDVAASNAASQRLQSELATGDCARPDNVTVTLRSDFHGAYLDYVKDEFNYSSISHWSSNRTIRLFMNQSVLPASTNDSRNQVVNLSGSPYNNVTVTNNSVEVEKGVPINYTLAIQPIAQGVEVSNIHDFEDQTIYRQPLDVIFVVDESGSMDNDPGGNASTKYEAARQAMRTFVGLLNATRDRVGLVGFWDNADQNAHVYYTNGQYLTDDFDAMNDSINTTESSGGTYLNAGMREAASISEFVSNSSRQRVIIALSDGENNNEYVTIDGTSYTLDEASEYWANRSQENGATVYTIGFDACKCNINEEMLKRMTHKGEGRYYYAKNSGSLKEVFKSIAAEVTETEAIARPPVSMNVSTGKSTYYPQIAGNTSNIANASANGTPVLNVNDPTAPQFSFALTVPDGANITMNSMAYTCDRWESTSQTVRNKSANETYIVTRCADLNESSEEVLSPSNVSIYTDGEDLTPLMSQKSAWYQADLNESLIPYRNNTTADLPSNQAIVVFDYEDDDKANSRLVLLFQIGYSEAQRSSGNVVTMNVNNVTVGD